MHIAAQKIIKSVQQTLRIEFRQIVYLFAIFFSPAMVLKGISYL